LQELKEICDECAEFCGGSFQLYISPEFEIEVTRPTIEFSEDLDIKEFGEEVKEGSYIY
jgi:hypothetical protein